MTAILEPNSICMQDRAKVLARNKMDRRSSILIVHIFGCFAGMHDYNDASNVAESAMETRA